MTNTTPTPTTTDLTPRDFVTKVAEELRRTELQPALVADDDRANGRTYIVAAPEAPSGRQLYDALRQALGMAPLAWEMPAVLLRIGGRVGDGLEALTRRRMPLDSEVLERLLGSAWYSPARIERELDWRAQVSLREGLGEMFGK